MILVVDNYDSFTYNLVDIIKQKEVTIVKYPDDASIYNLENIEALVISPGPGHPLDSQLLMHIIEHYKDKPILGVCLGAQALTCYYGGNVVQSDKVMHGKKDRMQVLEDTKLYEETPEYSEIMRYHSLISDSKMMPQSLKVTAQTSDCIQSFEHHDYLHFGIQYHPESFATEYGEQIINNFLKIVKEVRRDDTTDTITTT